MAVSMGTTSVPRWSTDLSAVEPMLVDASVTCVVIVTDASVTREFVDEVVARSVPATRVVVDDGFGGQDLARALADARVGWRFVIVGTEASAGRIRARVLTAGAVESEIAVVSTEVPDIGALRARDVFCAHCHSVTSAVAAVDGIAECVGCAAQLTVYYHYSRRHGAYLGYRADAEELS